MTMSEVLVTIAIFVLIMAAVAVFEENVFSYRKIASDSLETIQDSQVILKNISKEIRMTSMGSDGSYPIANAATSSFTFYADVNNDGNSEKIKYSIIGNILYRNIINPSGSPVSYTGSGSTTTIVKNIRNSTSTPIFEYFDQNYDGTTNSLSQPVNVTVIRLVKVNLTIDIDPTRSPTPRTYSMQINLRNLKNNL